MYKVIKHKGFKKKRIEGKKTNDKGFTLIEVLVSVAVLAILSIVIINIFISSAKVNNRARKQEGANTVAQIMMERIKALDIQTVLDALDGPDKDNHPYGLDSYTTSESSDTHEKIYEFNSTALDSKGNVYVDGTSTGSKYYVSLKLNPDDYTDNNGNPDDKNSNNVNSDMPEFNDISTKDNCVILRQITQHDDDARLEFATKGLTVFSRDVEISENITVSGIDVNQKIDMTVTYNSSGSDKKIYTYNLENFNIGSDGKSKGLYLFYQPASASDKITFNVNSSIGYTNPLDVYLVGQDRADSSHVTLNRSNVVFKADNVERLAASGNNTTGWGTQGNINFFTNYADIKDKNKNSLTHESLTSSPIKSLYNVDLKLWVGQTIPDDKSGAFLTMSSTKEN